MTVDTDAVSRFAAAALHGLLDAPGAPPGDGEPLPLLWHWLAFLDPAPQRDLGRDGHRRLGGLAGPPGLPRRMFAGVQLSVTRPPRVGQILARRTSVLPLVEKEGRSGRLAFGGTRHELLDGGVPAVTERYDVVFRGPAPAPAEGGRAVGERRHPLADGAWPWGIDVDVDAVVLFRFSALTYNPHRIHYDHPYATVVEGYPGLVVHGPLQAIGLMEVSRRYRQGAPLTDVALRAVGPAHAPCRLHLRGRPSAGGAVELAAFDGEGRLTMRGEGR